MNKVTILEDWCKGCGLCVRICPKAVLAISTTHLNKKGYYPAEVVAPEACIGCAGCFRTCPDTAIEIEKE
ncbi:MAG: 4Fe-4S binding protein [Lachnospiraceae bacterium]|nr:4Fe-4S binding protein [Lachnospiraceae bacterium]